MEVIHTPQALANVALSFKGGQEVEYVESYLLWEKSFARA